MNILRQRGGRLFAAPCHIRRVVVCLALCCSVYGTATVAASRAGPGPGGADVFMRYCAGCHGFDGFAAYPYAPSFSMGQRLHKSDPELLRSVLSGRHAMPYWQNKLSIDMLQRAIAYLRIMDQRYSSGLPPREQPLPELHYKFNPVGEEEDYWMWRGYK